MSLKSKAKAVGTAVIVAGGTVLNAAPSITVPTPDYTTFYAVAGVGLGITVIVGLAYKAKGFLR